MREEKGRKLSEKQIHPSCSNNIGVTTKIETRSTWDDLVLPESQKAQLHEICQRFNPRDQESNQGSSLHNISYGYGTTVLFSGGSDTCKIMAAEVMANTLGLDLYRINLSRVVSNFIG